MVTSPATGEGFRSRRSGLSVSPAVKDVVGDGRRLPSGHPGRGRPELHRRDRWPGPVLIMSSKCLR